MYFDDKKNSTNIDHEFSDKSNNILSRIFNFISRYKKLIIIGIVVIILFVVMLVIFTNKKSNNYLILTGDEVITIYQGDSYVEPGYKAYNSHDEDLNSNVQLESNLNTGVIGEYEIVYKLGDISKVRYVKVIAKPKDYVFMSLTPVNNKVDIYLKKGDKYIEPGYQTFSTSGIDLTDKVTITGNVDTSKKGTYTLNYSIVDSNGVTISKVRKVIVMDSELSLTLNNSNYTNQDVIINAYVIDEYFDYMILPNNEKVVVNNYSYKASSNGTYIFKAYDKKGNSKESSIKVNNIDKEAPSGSCSGSYKDGVSSINVNATDNIGIANYIVNGKSYTSKNITINSELKTVNVTINDKAGNSKNISCAIMDESSLKPIKPNSDENIIKQEETATLKVYISKKNSYYITRIWAYNPYVQLNKYDSPEYGINLYKPNSLLDKTINENNLNNKLVVGFNASGFYLRDVYDADSVSKYVGYDKTSVGTLVITGGKVVRNTYDKAYKTWYIVGVDKDNRLRIFTDLKTNSISEIETKKQWSNDVISSGIRNTFTFASPLVLNGVKSDIITSMPGAYDKLNRQAICQVDKNNFVLITGSNLNRNDLINIMLDLDCQTGSNLDGGGSIALLYKPKSSSLIETIVGNNRDLTEVGYFTE